MSITFDLCVVENNVCSQLDTESAVNMANLNSLRVQRKLGIPDDYCGVLSRETILKTLPVAAEVLVQELLKNPTDEFEVMERDDSRVLRLIQLFNRAIRENKEVSWS